MKLTSNSVLLRAKARIQALRAWSDRLGQAVFDKLLSRAQFIRARAWVAAQVATAKRRLICFTSVSTLASITRLPESTIQEARACARDPLVGLPWAVSMDLETWAEKRRI